MAATSITDCVTRLNRSRMRRLFEAGPQQAAPWIRALAVEGLAHAQVCYGRLLLAGTGMPTNEGEALQWFRRAAGQGDLDALNMVGRCLENGWGCDADVTQAASYYRTAAHAGHDWAQYNLGHLYLDGIGVKRDTARAYRYYLSAASQGHARAMNLAGRCCEEGWGTVRDGTAAVLWYRRSAEAGYFRGQYNWASVLLACRRIPEAAWWFERAACTDAIREAVLQVAAAFPQASPMAAMASRLQAGRDAHGV